MLRFLQRHRLVSQGLASGKRRLKPGDNAIADELETGWPARVVLMLGFVFGLGFLIFAGAQDEPLKKFVICLLIFATAIAQLWLNFPSTFASNSKLLLIFSACLTQLLGIKLVLFQASEGRIDLQLVPLLVPYAFAPLVLSVLLGRHHGLYSAVFCSLWGSFFQRSIDPVFLVISLITGFIAVFVTLQVRRRGRLIRAGVYVGFATWILAATFGQIGPILWESPASTDWRMIGWQSLAAVGMGIMTSVVVSGLLPVLENFFNITTDISWLEMADMNHPLLRRLSMEAPGTYHHSLAVANLAEAAAEAVGANPTICRVCSYFHDIGKLVKPEYFTENIRADANPHDELTPTMSALIIIAHVKEGMDLALKHKLNPRVVEVIQQHHGVSLVSYFYQRALQQQEDARLGGKIMNMRPEDVPEVHEETFRYPGPKPQTREAAIVMLSDAVESASRSLERPASQRLEDMIRGIVGARVSEGELDECPLTFADVNKVAETLRFTLSSMMHSRVAYPRKYSKEEQKKAAGKVSSAKSAA